MKWIDAIGIAQKETAQRNGKAADGTAQLTRLDASGLILFGKEAHKLLEQKTVRQPNAAHFRATTFDWYAWSLPVLGWFKRGDKFNLDAKWEKGPLDPTTSTALWAALVEQARYLDDEGIPFKLVRDPRGTPATFKTLAMDSYRKMQQLDPKSADAHPHKKGGGTGKPISHDPSHHSQAVRPPTIVVQAPITVEHPDGGMVTIQPPPVVVPPSVPAPVPPPPPGAESAPSSPDAGPGPGGGGGDGPPSPAPPVITPPPVIVPPTRPGGTPLVVQPPPVVAHPINAPQTTDPYDWYWRKHAADPVHNMPPGGDGSDDADASATKKKKKPAPDDGKKSDGGGVAILLFLLAMAMDN